MNEKEKQQEKEKLVPALREGVEIVKLILYKKISTQYAEKYRDRGADFGKKLAGAVINRLFAIENPDQKFQDFIKQNNEAIIDEIKNFPNDYKELTIPVSDALRVQFMCDCQDGSEDVDFLKKAQELGVLMVERNMPMPGSFLNLIAKIGVSEGILAPPKS